MRIEGVGCVFFKEHYMMIFSKLILTVSIFVLVSCGGGNSAPVPVAASAPVNVQGPVGGMGTNILPQQMGSNPYYDNSYYGGCFNFCGY